MLETARKWSVFPVVPTDHPSQLMLRGKLSDFVIRLPDGASASSNNRELEKPQPPDPPAICYPLITNVPLLT